MLVLDIKKREMCGYTVNSGIGLYQAAKQFGCCNDDQIQLWQGDRLVAYAAYSPKSKHYQYCYRPTNATGLNAGPCNKDTFC